MPRNTTNVSLRVEQPSKALRRDPVNRGETNEGNQTPGASGEPRHGRKRPGRAAALRTSNAVKRSQKWRSVAQGKLKRNPNPAQRAQRIREKANRA